MKNTQIKKKLTLMAPSILSKSTVISTGSTVNENKITDEIGIDENLIINKASSLESNSIIGYGSSITGLTIDIKNLPEESFVDVTDMASITQQPDHFFKLVKKYNDVSVEKEVISNKFEELKDEIQKRALNFNNTKESYQQRIQSLQERNFQLINENNSDKQQIEKFVDEEKFLINETERFKNDLLVKQKEIEKLDAELKKLDNIFHKVASSKNDSKDKINKLKCLFEDIFQTEKSLPSFETMKEGIKSMIERADYDIIISKETINSLSGDTKEKFTEMEEEISKNNSEKIFLIELVEKLIEDNKSDKEKLTTLLSLKDSIILDNKEKDDQLLSIKKELKEANEKILQQNNTIDDLESNKYEFYGEYLSLKDCNETMKDIIVKVENENEKLGVSVKERDDQLLSIEKELKEANEKILQQNNTIVDLESNKSEFYGEYLSLKDCNETMKDIIVKIKNENEKLGVSVKEKDDLILTLQSQIKERDGEITELRENLKCKNKEITELNEHIDDISFSYNLVEKDLIKLNSFLDEIKSELSMSKSRILELESILNSQEKNDEYIQMSFVIKDLTSSLKNLNNDFIEQKNISDELVKENNELKEELSEKNKQIESLIEENNFLQLEKFDQVSGSCNDQIKNNTVSDLLFTETMLDNTIDKNNKLIEQLEKQNDEKTETITELLSKIIDVEHSITEKEQDFENSQNEITLKLNQEKEISKSYKEKYNVVKEDLSILSDSFLELKESFEKNQEKNKELEDRIIITDIKYEELISVLQNLAEKVGKIIDYNIQSKVNDKIIELVTNESVMHGFYVSHLTGKITKNQFIEKGTRCKDIKDNLMKEINDMLNYIINMIRE